MGRQVKQLTWIQLCNAFGINEIRHTKDRQKKNRYLFTLIAWLVVIAMLVFYMVLLSTAFIGMGMGQMIPMYLYMVTSLMILFFSFFKAANVIFQIDTYEMLISLPVSKTAIVLSRFLSMYVMNLALSCVIMLPGIGLYSMRMNPGFASYLYSLIGILLLPLFPMTVSTAVGAGITAISSRMKHKSIVASILTLLLAVVLIAGNAMMGNGLSGMSGNQIKNLADMMTSTIQRTYPPAIWFKEAVADQNAAAFCLGMLFSILLFGIMLVLLARSFQRICIALCATSAKNNYKMQQLIQTTPLKALWKRELKQYFSSSIYVSNTLIGYIIMAGVAVFVLIMGPEKVEEVMGIPDVTARAFPFVLGITASIMPTTSCSISMEGKNWWLVQSMPVRAKELYLSKILLNLTVAAPFYFISVICSIAALKPSPSGMVWIILIPAGYIVFSSILGIAMNLKMPIMEWDSPVRVVKQSASTMITCLVDMFLGIVPIVLIMGLHAMPAYVIMLPVLILQGILSVVLYHHNAGISLITIGEK